MNRIQTAILALFVAAMFAGSAFAQTVTPPPEKPVPLTAPQQVAAAKALMAAGVQLAARITGMLEEARSSNETDRIMCLNRKLTEVNAGLRTVRDTFKSSRRRRPPMRVHTSSR